MSGFSGSTLKIEHQCPQCGGPVILEETDHFLSCPYCRVNLYIMTNDFHRYYFPPSSRPVEESVFVPYWRFRGMHFPIVPFSVENKFLDTNFLASDISLFPPTMGYRTQALKMRFVSSEMETGFLDTSFRFKDVTSIVIENLVNTTLQSDFFHNAFIGESVSMIYAPFYIKDNLIVDGILDRPVAGVTEQLMNRLKGSPAGRERDIKFVSALCPDCGGDLSGERNSIVLVCRNCSTAWHPVRGKMKKVAFGVIPGRGNNTIYVPFWKMDVDVQGVPFNSFADLIKTANLPRAVTPEMSDQKLYFYSPAFSAHPKIFLRLCRQMTMVQPDGTYEENFSGAELVPATIDDQEALQTIKVTIAHMSVLKRKIFPLLSDVRIVPQKTMLVYVPFTVRGNEFIHTEYNFGLQRNAMR